MSEDFYSIGNPRCKTCGFPIGNATRAIYNILRNNKIKDAIKSAEGAKSTSCPSIEKLTNTLIDPEINIDTGDILNELNIINICCRTCLITWKKFE
jgi:DNA-directed RNA polymerase subunit N (RpoN/RPB10)